MPERERERVCTEIGVVPAKLGRLLSSKVRTPVETC